VATKSRSSCLSICPSNGFPFLDQVKHLSGTLFGTSKKKK